MSKLSDEAPLLALDSNVETATRFLDRMQCNSWPVGERDFVVGMVNRRDMETAGAKSKASAMLRDLIDSDGRYPYVHADHPLSYALERMRESGVDVLPVVSRAGIHEISGVIGLKEILEAYGIPTSGFFSRSTPA